ncbi:amidohydrolase family protein [Sphingobium sp. H39-3-25]|uniref:amidohydrolase n=1 Tax=Sphingobium arseniciresistens TaxID=3030834 RepID=UPI0023BA16A8|nr:amidohydrolase family protein [Sphingobium arseniciresistens]
MDRRTFVASGAAGSALALPVVDAIAQTLSLSDVGKGLYYESAPKIYRAREVVTLDPRQPTARTIAVAGGRILAVGAFEEVRSAITDQPFTVDDTFADHVIVPGFVAQHDHPVLSALTMSAEILSIEDWVLPGRTIPAVKNKQDYLTRLAAAVEAQADPDELVLTWGYHPQFFGPLTGSELDNISRARPIISWARSCHEMILNSAALKKAGITADVYAGFSASAKEQSAIKDGRFYEQGFFALLPHVAPMVANRDRFRAGLELTRDFMHAKGVTIGCEPGGILSKPVQNAVNEVFAASDMPFRWIFMADGKSIVAANADDARVIPATEQLADWYTGMTSLAPKQIKLFADGAIYSQLMQVRQPYLDGHKGAWMMDENVFNRAFRLYWDAGYQIHIHVNGDAGLDRVLGALEANLRRNPREDHRTVIVHFAVSGADQVARIKKCGAIVSANPYYVTALADQYGKVGLGPKRADAMVRLGDVSRAGISWSLHSDMPMAPIDPLFLMWCAVNRLTFAGRIADPEQRVSPEHALRGVTIAAAYSLKLEKEIGTLEVGKRANMTVLAENPLKVDPLKIRDIAVWGTVMEGRVLPVAGVTAPRARSAKATRGAESEFAIAALGHAARVSLPG